MKRILLLALLAAFNTPATAAESDFDLLAKVKAAIATDQTLAKANLMVHVQDGVAQIGGAVSTDEANNRLKKLVQNVPGILQVQANCWVQAKEDALQKIMQDKLKLVPGKGELAPTTTTAQKNETPGYSPVPPPAPPAPAGPVQFPTIAPPRVPV
jgi:hypothetical protein